MIILLLWARFPLDLTWETCQKQFGTFILEFCLKGQTGNEFNDLIIHVIHLVFIFCLFFFFFLFKANFAGLNKKPHFTPRFTAASNSLFNLLLKLQLWTNTWLKGSSVTWKRYRLPLWHHKGVISRTVCCERSKGWALYSVPGRSQAGHAYCRET